MELLGISLVTQLACSLLLIMMYCATLYHTIKGTKFTFVILLTSLLIASNIGTLINIYGSLQIYNKDNTTELHIITINVGQMLQDLFFCIAHWLLASRYFVISAEIPYVIDGAELPED
jgi:hypothetical protein